MTSQSLSIAFQKIPAIQPIQFKIYTHAALQLFQGSWQPGKLGLLQCTHYLKEIHKAAKSGNADAASYLQYVEDRIKQLHETLNAIEENFQFKLDGLRSFLFEMQVKPLHMAPVHFANDLSFCFTRLIEQVDYLVRQYAILKRFKCIDSETPTPKQWMSDVQRLFTEIKVWHDTYLKKPVLQQSNG